MIQPLRARYGAKDNSHGLLEWQGQPTSLPSELLGLTDKPPGNHAPGECWWPSIGCGAVGEWWALWLTVPDETASRAGMVRSKVALWRLNEIGTVDDLRPALASLSGQETIHATSPELLSAVAEALVSLGLKRPPVVSDLEGWAGILADLWTRLWPDARRSFSARVALIPPQGGESVAPPLLYCVPRQRLSEWSDFPVISVSSDTSVTSRAVIWLIGKDDTTIDEVLKSCNSYPCDLKRLGTVARAAERLDKLRGRSGPHNALELLRTLAVLAPTPETAANLKAETLRELDRGFNELKPEFVFSLKNLPPDSLPVEGLPEAALATWVHCHSPHIPPNQAQQLLTGLGENKAQMWWQKAVYKALSEKLSDPDTQWAKAALNWLGLPDCAEILEAILPSTEKVETRLLNASTEINLSESKLKKLQEQTVVRQWSRLHAWVVMKSFLPPEAFRLQRQFESNAIAGLEYLVKHLPADDVINEVISTHDSQLIQLLAQRTVREPQLLQSLDVNHPAWCELWAAHIAAGGACWPPNTSHGILGSKLLDAIITEGKEPLGLILPLARDLPGIAYIHPDRAKLWSLLSPSSYKALLPLVADVFIRTCNAGQVVSSPETQLAQEVLTRTRATGLSTRVFVVLLSTNVSLVEQDLIRCISSSPRTDWQPGIAEAIGKAVSEKRWKGAAEKIYAQFMSGSIPELQTVVADCLALISKWHRVRFAIKTGNISHAPNMTESIVHRVADLGADLAPDELDDIWERAGGKRKDLYTGGTPTSRWQAAAKFAQHGKLNGGLQALVHELEKTHPYNPELRELAQYSAEGPRR